MRLRILNWNIEGPKLTDHRQLELLQVIQTQAPDLICLTESPVDFLGRCWYPASADLHFSSKVLRKVVLFSKTPWSYESTHSDRVMPGGRLVHAITRCGQEELSVFGMCIPWSGSRYPAQKKWADHAEYIETLQPVVAELQSRHTLLVGDFNQRVPSTYVPKKCQAQLRQLLADEFILATGMPPLEVGVIDHVAHSSSLRSVHVEILSPKDSTGRSITDHTGVVVDLESI